jgi:hypothetical protein
MAMFLGICRLWCIPIGHWTRGSDHTCHHVRSRFYLGVRALPAIRGQDFPEQLARKAFANCALGGHFRVQLGAAFVGDVCAQHGWGPVS